MIAATWKSYLFAKRFFRTPNCLEQLLLSKNYFLVTNTFSDQLLLEDKYFFSTATISEELHFRISNYSKHVLFRTGSSSEQLLLQKKNFFKAGISWEHKPSSEQSFFSEKLVMRNQLHSIYTWKDFPLTMIHSFKYTLSWSALEIPQFFIIENSKQCINFNTWWVTNVTFQKVGCNCGIFKQALENRPNEFHRICS